MIEADRARLHVSSPPTKIRIVVTPLSPLRTSDAAAVTALAKFERPAAVRPSSACRSAPPFFVEKPTSGGRYAVRQPGPPVSLRAVAIFGRQSALSTISVATAGSLAFSPILP